MVGKTWPTRGVVEVRLLSPQPFGGQRRASHARRDLRKRDLARRRHVARKRREPAVVGGPQPIHRNESRRLDHAVGDLLACSLAS